MIMQPSSVGQDLGPISRKASNGDRLLQINAGNNVLTDGSNSAQQTE